MEPQMNADGRRWEETGAPGQKPFPHVSLTEKIIGCVYRVANALGAGFLEKVYENALAHELSKSGFEAEQQARRLVMYDGVVVGEYYADILVNGLVIVEIKAVKALDKVHHAQCMNYLKAAGLEVCLLVNFGKPHLEIRRIAVGQNEVFQSPVR